MCTKLVSDKLLNMQKKKKNFSSLQNKCDVEANNKG